MKNNLAEGDYCEMLKEENRQMLLEFISALPENYQMMFQEIAEFAIQLGYTPKKTKSKDFALDFSKSKVKRTIMKMEIHDNGIKTNGPGLRLKFYASKDYSGIFRNGVQKVIEEFDGKYTGCYGCGKCKGEPEGYTYTYSNGTQVFRCGHELIAIKNVSSQNIEEIETLLTAQDEYFLRHN